MVLHARPELDLICLCARTEIGNEHGKAISRLAEEQIDWSYILTVALGHRAIPLLYRALSSTCPDALPKDALTELRAHFYANSARNLLLAHKLIEILRLIDSHEIRGIPFKGPTLAVLAYGTLALRQCGDLDILVPETDYERVRQLLIKQGFRATIEHEWETELTDESGIIAVDLHKRITARELSCPLSFDYLSERLQPIRLAGNTICGLCPEDTLLMLSLQLTKDSHPQLSKVCDIAELVRSHTEVNWANAVKQTKNLGGERIASVGFYLTRKLLGVSLPPELTPELPLNNPIHRLVDHTVQKMFPQAEASLPDQLTAQRFHWLVRERLRDKIYPYYLRYVEELVTPCRIDREFLPLPEQFVFVYYFLRPIRLIGKYGLLLWRRMIQLTLAVARS